MTVAARAGQRARRNATGDRALAAALARDVDAAFAGLVDAYGDRMFAFALNLVGDRHAAEEIAQDAFVAAFRALRGYAPERRRALSIGAWLGTIVLNRVRNRARRAPALSLDAPGAPPVPTAPPHEEPSQRALASESREALRDAIARLPLRYRVPVVLRHVEGRSYADMSALLAQPVGTVKANVHRGLALLRRDDALRTIHGP